MKKLTLLIFLFLSLFMNAQNLVSISGQVTDFNGNPIDGANVFIKDTSFNNLYETISDKNGHYKIEVTPGEYASMYVLRLEEYPRNNAVPEEDMTLEFWAWNIIADRDLIINPRYHRLELYGTTTYLTSGRYNGFNIYFRPMSLQKVVAVEQAVYTDKKRMEKDNIDVSVLPENLEVMVYADNEPLKINFIQPVKEYVGKYGTMTGYLVQVDRPEKITEKPYIIFRVVATNTEFGEKGENIYFYRVPDILRQTYE